MQSIAIQNYIFPSSQTRTNVLIFPSRIYPPSNQEPATLNPLPSPILPHRHGGQPFNRNALKHGLHTRKGTTRFAPLTHTIPALQPALFADSEVFNQVVIALGRQINTLSQASQNASGLRSNLPWHRLILHGNTLLNQIINARQRCLQPHEHLQFLAAHALELIRYDFRSSGITRDADSFRSGQKKSDLNSLASLQDGFPVSLFPALCSLISSLWRIKV